MFEKSYKSPFINNNKNKINMIYDKLLRSILSVNAWFKDL